MDTSTKYLGPFKVLSVKDSGKKTPLGSELLEIKLDRDFPDTSVLYTKELYDSVVTGEPLDLTEFRKLRYERMVQRVMAILLEENIDHGDVGYVADMVKRNLHHMFNRAVSILWTKSDANYIPGGDDPHYYHSALEARDIIEGYGSENK